MTINHHQPQSPCRGLLLTAILTVAGCVQNPGATERVGAPIIDGTPDPDDHAVVMVIARMGLDLEKDCSGTVVSPHVVATAAHCLDPALLGSTRFTFRIFLGSNVRDSTQSGDQANFAPVSETHFDPAFDSTSFSNGHDVGVVITSTPIAITPVPLLRTRLDPTSLGASVRLVGFGLSTTADADSDGARLVSVGTLVGLSDNELTIDSPGHSTCLGDSGGPSLLTVGRIEYLAGIHSHSSVRCDTSDYDTRIDANFDFIDTYIRSVDPGFLDDPVDAGPEGDSEADAGPAGPDDASGDDGTEPPPSCGCVAASRVQGARHDVLTLLAAFFGLTLGCRRRRELPATESDGSRRSLQ